MLWRITRASPFDGFRDGPLNSSPRELSPEEYLEIHTEGATAEEWKDLARSFLNIIHN